MCQVSFVRAGFVEQRARHENRFGRIVARAAGTGAAGAMGEAVVDAAGARRRRGWGVQFRRTATCSVRSVSLPPGTQRLSFASFSDGDRVGIVLAIVAALAAILLAHRRHHAPAQRLACRRASGARQAAWSGRATARRRPRRPGGGAGHQGRAVLRRQRRDAAVGKTERGDEKAVEPSALLRRERAPFPATATISAAAGCGSCRPAGALNSSFVPSPPMRKYIAVSIAYASGSGRRCGPGVLTSGADCAVFVHCTKSCGVAANRARCGPIGQRSATSRMTISLTCSIAPSTSPVWPSIWVRLSHAMSAMATASRISAAMPEPRGRGRWRGSRCRARRRSRRSLRGGWPAANDRPSRRAGGNRYMQHRHRRARRAVRGDQRRQHQRRIGEARQRADPQQDRQHQRADAVSADPAVAHDVELAFARPAAAEAVRGVGEAVLMQSSRLPAASRRRRAPRPATAAGRARCASA